MTRFEPRDPAWEARCRAAFDAQPIVRTLGIVMVRLEPGLCEMRLPFNPDFTQQHGFFHAGMVSTLADNAGGFAAYSLMPAGSEVLAVEFKINLMAPARGEVMIARGRVLKPGRTLTITTVEVAMLDGGAEKDVAIMQQTCMALSGGAGDR
ncbi:PaaI family thioesterase [Azospirillum halopraeferens]|uniref:PaaI family thioesterase n=1 Tax=Azospirillum halopraeferens TaxID=34010 RepID=UPI00041064EC|nr:PaaI family thioesterase [Azospirillum halopraeferens]